MQTIKRALRAVRRWRLPQPGDPQQARALGRVLRFFAAVLVLTLVARGAAGALMPVWPVWWSLWPACLWAARPDSPCRAFWHSRARPLRRASPSPPLTRAR